MQTVEDSHLEMRFTRVFATNLWEDNESISGPGSRSDSFPVRDAFASLEYVIKEYNIETIADVPCGDLNWIHHFLAQHPSLKYTGYDIVKPLVEKNKTIFPHIQCVHFDAVAAVLPKVDLIFSKDLLIHLDHPDIDKLMRNFALSESKWILATNNFGLGNSDLRENIHGDSACRYVDLLTMPFNYPAPVWKTELFGLWACKDIANHFCL